MQTNSIEFMNMYAQRSEELIAECRRAQYRRELCDSHPLICTMLTWMGSLIIRSGEALIRRAEGRRVSPRTA